MDCAIPPQVVRVLYLKTFFLGKNMRQALAGLRLSKMRRAKRLRGAPSVVPDFCNPRARFPSLARLQIIFAAAVAALLSPAVAAEGLSKTKVALLNATSVKVEGLLNVTTAVKAKKMEIMRDELEVKLSALKVTMNGPVMSGGRCRRSSLGSRQNLHVPNVSPPRILLLTPHNRTRPPASRLRPKKLWTRSWTSSSSCRLTTRPTEYFDPSPCICSPHTHKHQSRPRDGADLSK